MGIPDPLVQRSASRELGTPQFWKRQANRLFWGGRYLCSVVKNTSRCACAPAAGEVGGEVHDRRGSAQSGPSSAAFWGLSPAVVRNFHKLNLTYISHLRKR